MNQSEMRNAEGGSRNNFRLTIFVAAMAAVLGAVGYGLANPDVLARNADKIALTTMALPLLGTVVPATRLETVVNAELNPVQFAQDIDALKTSANTIVAGLPPLEQFEASAELSYCFRALQRTAADLITLMEAVRGKTNAYAEKVAAQAEAAAEAKLLAKGTHILKTDAEAAQTKAVTDKETEVRATLTTEAKEATEGEARRAKLVTDKVLTATVAASIQADFFKADGYDGRLAKLNARLTTLKEKNLMASEPFLADIVTIPLDEAGETTFNARLKAVEGMVVSANASRSGGDEQRATLAGVGASNGDSDDVLIF